MNAPFLTVSRLAEELAKHPGLIPVAVDAQARRIKWLDMGRYHCYEGFFRQSLTAYESLRKTPPETFYSDFDGLNARGDCNNLAPTAFIFHAGRCGSTLLAKVLARSRAHMVFSEAAAHNQIWQALPRDPGEAVALYRKLILAMGRKRLPGYSAHIIKFTSFNIMKFPIIRAAFPEVPALFLFREPSAIMKSYKASAPQWMGRELGIGSQWSGPEAAVSDFFKAAGSVSEPCFRCLDYAFLGPEFFPQITNFFRLNCNNESIDLMLPEFSRDAKSRTRLLFLPPVPSTAASPRTRLRPLYERLCGYADTQWKFRVD